MLVKIKRQENADSIPYWQTFEYNGDKKATIAAVLDFLNYNDDSSSVKFHHCHFELVNE